MNAANQVRISKLKIKKDKMGQKWCTIEVTRALDESDSYTNTLAAALEHMKEHVGVSQMKLSERVTSRNLIFFPAEGVDKPSEAFHNLELGNFKLKREEGTDRDWLVLTYEFTVPLIEARRWLIPSIGDDILCVVEDCQLSFDKE
jgi:hypothetical protein